MSGVSSSISCPICGEDMDVYSDWKPIDNVSGSCVGCGFAYRTITEQMSLKEINELRKEFNENNDHLSKKERMKPMTKKQWSKFSKQIKEFY